MDWMQVQSLEALKELGKLKDVAALIEKDLVEVSVPKNSWKNLWQCIVRYRNGEETKVVSHLEGSWKEVSSVEALKKIGTFKEIKAQVSQVCLPLKVKAKGWDELYEFIQNHSLYSTGDKQVKVYESLYFKDEVSELIFYLLELEGDARLKKLGVNNRYYKDKEQASTWKNQLMKKIHPDQSTHVKAEEATKELNRLYGSMIKFAK